MLKHMVPDHSLSILVRFWMLREELDRLGVVFDAEELSPKELELRLQVLEIERQRREIGAKLDAKANAILMTINQLNTQRGQLAIEVYVEENLNLDQELLQVFRKIQELDQEVEAIRFAQKLAVGFLTTRLIDLEEQIEDLYQNQ